MLPLDDSVLLPRVRVLRIICGGMAAALVLAVGLFIWVAHSPDAGLNIGPLPVGGLPIVSLAAAGFAIMVGWVLLTVLRPFMASRLRQIANQPASEEADLVSVGVLYSTVTILTFALAQSAGLVAGIAYLLEREPAVLAIPCLALLYMLLAFPTLTRARNWIEIHLSRLAELRQQAV